MKGGATFFALVEPFGRSSGDNGAADKAVDTDEKNVHMSLSNGDHEWQYPEQENLDGFDVSDGLTSTRTNAISTLDQSSLNKDGFDQNRLQTRDE